MVGDPVPDGPIHCSAPKGLKFPGVTLCFFQTMRGEDAGFRRRAFLLALLYRPIRPVGQG
jgi:hypothetical protein